MDDIQKIQLHYYFNDENKHSMNAFISHKSEGHLLNLIKEISDAYDLQLHTLEFEALSEGSLKKNIIIIGRGVLILVLAHYLTTWDRTGKYLKELEFIEKVEERLEKGKKISKRVSDHYQTLIDDNSIKKVGYLQLDKNDNPMNDEEEKIIERADFNKFILEEEVKKESSEEDVKIYLTRVVLSGMGNFSGLYKNNTIGFSIADKIFKDQIKDGKITFKNGFYIKGKLKITTIVNGKKETTHYEVVQIHEFGDDNSKPKKIIHKKDDQLSLFDER